MARHPPTQLPGPATNGMDPPAAGPVEVGGGARADAGLLDAVAARTRDRLTADRHWQGFVSVRGEGCARVRVSPPLVEQAIAVIDDLVRRSRARGWRISTVQRGSAVTPFEACVVVHEIHGVVSVIERARQVPHQPTLEDLLDAFERRAATLRPSQPRPVEVAEGLAPPLTPPPGQNPFAADLRAWREARDLRELADAVEAQAHHLGNRSTAVQQWLADARHRAGQIDPAAAIASRR